MLVEQSLVIVALLSWLLWRALRDAEQRQRLSELAAAAGVALDERRIARAVAAERGRGAGPPDRRRPVRRVTARDGHGGKVGQRRAPCALLTAPVALLGGGEPIDARPAEPRGARHRDAVVVDARDRLRRVQRRAGDARARLGPPAPRGTAARRPRPRAQPRARRRVRHRDPDQRQHRAVLRRQLRGDGPDGGARGHPPAR